jgi:hypothetical protein
MDQGHEEQSTSANHGNYNFNANNEKLKKLSENITVISG